MINPTIFKFLTSLMAGLVFLVAFHGPAKPAEKQPTLEILLFNSWQKNFPWQVAVERGFEEELKGTDLPFQLYIENLDTARFPEMAQSDAMKATLQEKYNSKLINIVISEGLPAASFLKEWQDFLPSAKRIYINPGALTESWDKKSIGRETIISVLQDYHGAISEMMRLVAPRKVYVIADTSSDSGERRIQATKAAFAKMAGEIETEYLLNLPMTELLKKVSELPDHSAIFYALIFTDGAGQKFLPYRAMQLISERANAPAFSHWESLIGSGVMGGYLLSGERIGQVAAQSIINSVLGMKPISAQNSAFGYYYDWRQLKRWGIDEGRLPPGAVIQYHTATFYEKYTWLIIATLSSLALFAFLSLSLLVVNRKRKLAIALLQNERQLLEERVAERTRELKHEINTKNRFFSIISHDLKSPFTYLLGITKMMSDMADSISKDKLIEYANNVNVAGEQFYELLSNLLEWSRLQMDGVKLEPELIRMDELAQESVDFLNPLAMKKGIFLSNKIRETIAFADQEMVRTVFRNLIANSLKFTPTGGSVEILSSPIGDMVQVTVTDTGVGMTKEQIEKVFSLDETTSTTGTAGETGTGLGMPLCKEMLERNGGKIWVENNYEKGTQVHFSLPIRAKEK